jgi:hypothetical protein
MILTNEQLLKLGDVLDGLDPKSAHDVAWLDALRIERLNARLADDVRAVRKIHNKLFRTYGVGPDSNGNYTVAPEIEEGGEKFANPNYSRYWEDLGELLEGTVEVDVKPLPASIFEGLALTLGELRALLPIMAPEDGGVA